MEFFQILHTVAVVFGVTLLMPYYRKFKSWLDRTMLMWIEVGMAFMFSQAERITIRVIRRRNAHRRG